MHPVNGRVNHMVLCNTWKLFEEELLEITWLQICLGMYCKKQIKKTP